MKIILEFIYTGSVKEDSLTKDNTVEAFHAADYFQLTDLQDIITKIVNNIYLAKNYLPELLSKLSEKMPSIKNNSLLNLLVDVMIATIPLITVEFGRLSIVVFRYSAILAAKQVSDDAYRTFIKRLPILEQMNNSVQVGNRFITDNQKVAEELEPLVKLIDFKKIDARILAEIIEPLEIIPNKIIYDAYRYIALLGTTINESDYVWDNESLGYGTKLIIEDDEQTVRAASCLKSCQCVRAKAELEIKKDKGIFEWDVIVEKDCEYAWIGVCASEMVNYEKFAGDQPTSWVLGSSGQCVNSAKRSVYCPSFGDGTIVTVHIDMNKRTCAFSVNGKKHREMLEWNNLPLKLYPIVSLCYPGRLRIRPHQKN
ncbi:hypothetical protein GLOIN_2v810536 [Rhizophagus clarus]|uniref:B30.2/SPRY domain-containing protein n=1 Tax=Rhizophagus clarus TaxID=94130 RepID=A0A8H3M3V5_9GLOM|nr:hypothetical protein GLOIN_2v810536 [Rhizophagus clarus]